MRRPLEYCLVCLGVLFTWLPGWCGQEFLAGADMSHLAFFEQRGVVYRSDGHPEDALVLLKNRGLNCIRLRLFTSSTAEAASDPYNRINNLDYTLPLARRVKNAGLKFMLDFHYSDTWADPGHQAKPAAWTNLTLSALVAQMRAYNSNSIAAFRAGGAMPDYVQIGNEITAGMLWPDGRNTNAVQWAQLGQLMKAAAQGIADAAGAEMPKLIVHIDKGGDWGATQWFFDNLNQQQVPFDIIGQSYYPFWHGNLAALKNCLTNAVRRYGKPVIVAETAFPFMNSSSVQGIPATPEGQVQFAIELARIVKSLPNNMGAGVFWWGTEYQTLPGYSLAGFNYKSFFDQQGNLLPVAKTWGQLTAAARLDVELEQGSLRLSWPISGAGMVLVSATNPTSTSEWLPVEAAVGGSSHGFSVIVPIDPVATRFYRLTN